MVIAYEDVPVAPKSQLKQNLMSCSLENKLAAEHDCETRRIPQAYKKHRQIASNRTGGRVKKGHCKMYPTHAHI